MMQELHKMYTDIPVPPNLKEDILTYCRTAEEKPAPFVVRYAKPIALAAACVVVLFVSLAATGNLFGDAGLPMGTSSDSASSVGEEPTPESAVNSSAPEGASTTRGTMRTTILRDVTTTRKKATAANSVTAKTTRPQGTGGDQNSCEKHVMFYHGIDGRLIDYVGSDKVKAYLEEYGIVNTSHLTREEREQYNVVHFIQHIGLTKQEFIAAMGWTNILDEKPDTDSSGVGYFNDQYTYREHVDALYSDDQTLIDRVYYYEIIVVPTSTTTTATTTEKVTEPTASVSIPEFVRTTTRAQQ